MPDAAEKARALLEKNTGSATERAQAYATLAVAEAVDRLAAAVANTDKVEVIRWGAGPPADVEIVEYGKEPS